MYLPKSTIQNYDHARIRARAMESGMWRGRGKISDTMAGYYDRTGIFNFSNHKLSIAYCIYL